MRTFSFFLVAALAACGGSVEAPTGTGGDTGSTSGTSSTPSQGSGSGGSKSGSSTSTSPAPYGSNCKYPPTNNPPECPPAYTRQPPPSCSTIGLECWYPGVGDGDGNGCWSTALLACQPDRDGDGGTDGDPTTGHWVGAQ